jgi:hypothetical protein
MLNHAEKIPQRLHDSIPPHERPKPFTFRSHSIGLCQRGGTRHRLTMQSKPILVELCQRQNVTVAVLIYPFPYLLVR